MKDAILKTRYLEGLAIYSWLGTIIILLCIAIWPQYKIWMAFMALIDILIVLPMLIVERVKHCKVAYRFPLRYAIMALVIATLIFMAFFQAVSNLRGLPIAAFDREDRFIWDPFPWGLQGVFIWFFTYNYYIRRRNKET